MIGGQTPPREWKTKGGKGKKGKRESQTGLCESLWYFLSLSLTHTHKHTHILIVRTYTIYLLGSEQVTVYTIYLGHVPASW